MIPKISGKLINGFKTVENEIDGLETAINEIDEKIDTEISRKIETLTNEIDSGLQEILDALV